MRTLSTAFMLAVGGLLATGAPASAAGMPQLDVSKFPPQIIWLVISFVILYVIMARVALPRVSQVLEEREKRINDALNQAASFKKEAEAAAEAYEKALSEARHNAQARIREVHDEYAATAAAEQAKLAEKLAADVKAGEAKINDAKLKALGNIAEVAVSVARDAAEKLSGVAVDEKAATKAVDAAMKERS